MDNKRIAVLAGVIGVLSLVVQFTPETILAKWFDHGLPSWVPMFGTVGQTGLLYTYGAKIVGPLFTVVPAVGLGYYVGRQLALSREYRRFLGAVVAGTTIPIVAAWGAAITYGTFSAGDLILAIAFLLVLFVTVSLVVTISAFAGAALAHILKTESIPSQPTENDTTAPSTPKKDSSADHSPEQM